MATVRDLISKDLIVDESQITTVTQLRQEIQKLEREGWRVCEVFTTD